MMGYKPLLAIIFFMLLLSSISTARFIQPDSIIGDKYNPQNLNRYSYVLNNPYKYTDPTGKDAVSIEITNSVGSGNFLSGTTYGVAFVNFNPGLAGVGGSSSLVTYTRQIEGGTSAPGTTGVSVNLGYSPFATTPQDLVSGAKSGELSVPLGGFGISVPSAAQSSSDKIKGLGFSGGVGLDIMLFNFKDVTYSEAKINILGDKNKGTGNGQNNLNLNSDTQPNTDNRNTGGSLFRDTRGANPSGSGSGSVGRNTGSSSSGGRSSGLLGTVRNWFRGRR